ncbi:unnamed protein product [Closterium sp. NIES-54]
MHALARESGIHRKCLTNWKRTAEFLKDVHSAWKRMHGRGRASWYPLMESGRGNVAEQCKSFWQFVRAKRRERGIDTAWIINAHQTPLWLEMPATTIVEETGVCSVPIRSAGYQKQRVTVMLACTADGRKLKPWVFFKRKTLLKGDFPAGREAVHEASVRQTRQELDAGAGFLPQSPHRGGEGEAPRDELRAGDHPVRLYGGGAAVRCLHQQEL